MKQKQIRTVNEGLGRATQAMGGAAEHGVEIGLRHNTLADIAADRAVLVQAHDAHEVAKVVLNEHRQTMRALIPRSIEFVTLVREVLRQHISRQYSSAWQVVGFDGSLEVPRTVSGLTQMIERMTAYFAANPQYELVSHNLSSAGAKALCDEISAAENALNNQRTIVGQTLAVRNVAFRQLCKRISNLASELRILIGDNDPRYLAFGLKIPAARPVPEAPKNVEVKIVSEQLIEIEWEPTPHASHYRVWLKEKGSEQESQVVGSVKDKNFAFEDLPPDRQFEVMVTAVNSAGESLRSDPLVLFASPVGARTSSA